MIIGSFPIGKFTDPRRRDEIKKQDIDFYFGGEKNLLWKLLGDTFDVPLSTKAEIKKFLQDEGIGIGDVIRSCVRNEGRASDKDLLQIEWNAGLIDSIRKNHITKLFFTSKTVERWFYRLFPDARDIAAITLISPSAQSVRALGALPSFQAWRKVNPQRRAYFFILKSYKKAFLTRED